MKKRYIVVGMLFMLVIVPFVAITSYMAREKHLKTKENKRIESARMALEYASDSKENDDIVVAKALIAKVTKENVKDRLSLYVRQLEEDIEKEKLKEEYHDLLELVKKNLNRQELEDAKLKIEQLEYLDLKEELLEEIDEIDSLVTLEEQRLAQLEYSRKMKEKDEMKVVSTPKEDALVLETLVGKVTAFTPYCSDGCSGTTASGKFVGNGDIYQYDSEYGMVHIVAGDASYPFGTIVRMKNVNYFGEDIYAIVLDRGGAIGKGRRALFDLLFATEENANRFGIAYNVECEILRLGY